jgi:hypothetical protein
MEGVPGIIRTFKRRGEVAQNMYPEGKALGETPEEFIQSGCFE